MSLREFKQYLELLKFSGQSEIFTNFNQINIKFNKSVSSETAELADFPTQITCPTINSDNDSDFDSQDDQIGLDNLAKRYASCNKCQLAKSRLKFVYGEGNHNANILIIGEGPGADENITGRPFIGEAGQLLTKMLSAINLDRKNIYITNIVKCRPPQNRNPLPEEINACLPYLEQQIRIIKPKVILLLGKTACSTILKQDKKMEEFRNLQPYDYNSISVWATYHPSALLRRPEWKKDAWADLQKFRDYLIHSNIK